MGQGVGISATFLLFVLLLYAKSTTNLVLPDRWLGTSLLLIGTVVTLSAALVNWPIGSGFVFGFGPVVVIIFLWSFVFLIRSKFA
ncbi:hypothetical protein HALLA_20170 (plasmid) [Halostagnicola larsenii XH-48]|uniref:Uncharacterized protein n=1 Tax=Halostagnicola larsenii XH-48 TaxID=797299 RepID=W0JUH5_9EURY|nr:hypothetical protein HALLA_20170 [Halostagnicola larsenii XH-48]